MKGSLALTLPLSADRTLAARIIDGRLDDLLVDPTSEGRMLAPGTIYRARLDRHAKGLGGAFLDMGGVNGYLRQADGVSARAVLDVQISAHAEPGKAVPVTTRVACRGRHAVATPGAPGINVSRTIRDPDRSRHLLELANAAWPHGTGAGLILRTQAEIAPDADIVAELAALAQRVARITGAPMKPGLLDTAPDAATTARRDWDVDEWVALRNAAEAGARAPIDLHAAIHAALQPRVALSGGGFLFIEPTRAFVAIDVNSGTDFSPSAGLKTTIEAARTLPSALRIRGLGGKIVIDPASSAKKDRHAVDAALKKAFRPCSVDTSLVGWSPLGHIELQRRRERLPLSDLLPEGLE